MKPASTTTSPWIADGASASAVCRVDCHCCSSCFSCSFSELSVAICASLACRLRSLPFPCPPHPVSDPDPVLDPPGPTAGVDPAPADDEPPLDELDELPHAAAPSDRATATAAAVSGRTSIPFLLRLAEMLHPPQRPVAGVTA